MATSGPQTDAENYDLECAVCTEILRDARLLRCGHHFCKVCLEQIADRHPQGAVPCPTCRHVTDNKMSVDELPRYAATSEFSRRVTDALERRGERVQPKKCDICKLGDSEMVCFRCIKGFCGSCNDKHKKQLEHQVYPVSPFMYCKSHKETVMQLYCKACKDMICITCALDAHVEHEVDDMKDILKDIRRRLRQSRDNMDDARMESEAAHRLKETLDKAVDIQKTFSTSIVGIRKTLKDMLVKVETLEQKVGEKLESGIKLLKGMDADMDDYLASKVKLGEHLTYLIEKASDPEVVIRQSEVPAYDKDTYKHVISTAEVELPELGTTLTDIQTQLDKMGKQLELDYTTYHLCRDRRPLSTLTKVADIDVGLKVYGMAVDSRKQRIVIRKSDKAAPICVYNFQGQQIQVLGQGVKGLTNRDSSCQSVAIDTKRDLYLLPMTDGSLLTMDMNGKVQDQIQIIQKKLHGAAYSTEDLYITSSAPSQVYLVNPVSKQMLASFQPDTTFVYPYNVCTGSITTDGKSQTVICVSDYGSDCIKVLDLSGRLIHTYGQGETELNAPRDVCTDPGGHLIVGDQENNRVVSFWREGDRDMSQVLLGPDKLKRGGNPSLALDPVTRKLFVGYSALPIIQVFQG